MLYGSSGRRVPNLGIANIADGAFTASHWRIHNVNHYRQVLNFLVGRYAKTRVSRTAPGGEKGIAPFGIALG